MNIKEYHNEGKEVKEEEEEAGRGGGELKKRDEEKNKRDLSVWRLGAIPL